MNKLTRQNVSDLRGITQLSIDATTGTTRLVDKMHHTIQLGHSPIGESCASSTSGVSGLAYKSIIGSALMIGKGLDLGMTQIESLLSDVDASSSNKRSAFISILNGVCGDYLVDTENPLALTMSAYCADSELSPSDPGSTLNTVVGGEITNKIIIFVHGLSLNHHHWTSDDTNPSQELAIELGYTPIYLQYNTGMPISSNGRELAVTLEELVKNWPTPVDEIALVGHSMGGLVSRSAVHSGSRSQHEWRKKLRRLISIGTPHSGAPLEQVAVFLDGIMEISPYSIPFTPIIKARSSGINNLGNGCITDTANEFVQLPEDVECFALAALIRKKRGPLDDKLTGDGLVPVDSALGKNKDPDRVLDFPESHQWVGFGIGHNEMLSHPEVYNQLRNWL